MKGEAWRGLAEPVRIRQGYGATQDGGGEEWFVVREVTGEATTMMTVTMTTTTAMTTTMVMTMVIWMMAAGMISLLIPRRYPIAKREGPVMG